MEDIKKALQEQDPELTLLQKAEADLLRMGAAANAEREAAVSKRDADAANRVLGLASLDESEVKAAEQRLLDIDQTLGVIREKIAAKNARIEEARIADLWRKTEKLADKRIELAGAMDRKIKELVELYEEFFQAGKHAHATAPEKVGDAFGRIPLFDPQQMTHHILAAIDRELPGTFPDRAQANACEMQLRPDGLVGLAKIGKDILMSPAQYSLKEAG